ncbi:acetyl-CoA synthetase-like protein [Rhizodiscina lignyota]|uniref:Acetyl-CoA synthetase-like protein n=1 Tax=Rhizodiscina lignyota TaxID=1504668 RepID=A0A9P4IAX6_9PEZI|nr:acetyl-CoA synthetase-like protein [Rhizodiscina lignyota]
MDSPPGQRLIPIVIDELAERDGDRVMASCPRSSDLSQGYRDVTIRDFANAINRLGAFLESRIGFSKTFETAGYFGLVDMRYHIITIALIKLGWKPFFSAPRNSKAIHLHLFEKLNCKTVLHAPKVDVSQLMGAESMSNLDVHEIPELDDLLWGKEQPKQYPYTKSVQEARDEPFMVLHTSGTTGMPKPLAVKHGWMLTCDLQQHTKTSAGRHSLVYRASVTSRFLTAFPPWHSSGGLVAFWTLILFSKGHVMVWGPPDRMVIAAQDLIDCVKYGNCDIVAAIPQTLVEASKNQEALELLWKMREVYFGGGPLDTAAGDLIRQKTPLYTAIASVEAAWIGFMVEKDDDDMDWEYFHYDHELSGVEFHEEHPGLYEMVCVRDSKTEPLHAIWTTFPEEVEYHTKDLYSKHPKKADYWRYEGRLDDLIVFATGAKYNPMLFEEILRTKSPLLTAALLYGTGRQQTALILELRDPKSVLEGKEKCQQVLDELWQTVQEAVYLVPQHAVPVKTHVVFASPTKPFRRASKGTVQRYQTYQDYKEELDEVYRKFGDEKQDAILKHIRPDS